jgi:hypothetical protein
MPGEFFTSPEYFLLSGAWAKCLGMEQIKVVNHDSCIRQMEGLRRALEAKAKESDEFFDANNSLSRENEALQEKLREKDATIERQGWNLGGCSTLAIGYELDTEFSKEMALPALGDVKKLALRERELQEKLWVAYALLTEAADHVPEGLEAEIKKALGAEEKPNG